LCPLPASPETVALYLAALAAAHRAKSLVKFDQVVPWLEQAPAEAARTSRRLLKKKSTVFPF